MNLRRSRKNNKAVGKVPSLFDLGVDHKLASSITVREQADGPPVTEKQLSRIEARIISGMHEQTEEPVEVTDLALRSEIEGVFAQVGLNFEPPASHEQQPDDQSPRVPAPEAQGVWAGWRWISLVLGVLLMISVIVLPARDALPGERMFPIKRVTERLSLALSPNDSARAEIYLRMAGVRLEAYRLAVSGISGESQYASSLLIKDFGRCAKEALGLLEGTKGGQTQTMARNLLALLVTARDLMDQPWIGQAVKQDSPDVTTARITVLIADLIARTGRLLGLEAPSQTTFAPKAPLPSAVTQGPGAPRAKRGSGSPTAQAEGPIPSDEPAASTAGGPGSAGADSEECGIGKETFCIAAPKIQLPIG